MGRMRLARCSPSAPPLSSCLLALKESFIEVQRKYHKEGADVKNAQLGEIFANQTPPTSEHRM